MLPRVSEAGKIDLILDLDIWPDLVLDHYVEYGRNQDVDLLTCVGYISCIGMDKI